jgi:hypothetical protein
MIDKAGFFLGLKQFSSRLLKDGEVYNRLGKCQGIGEGKRPFWGQNGVKYGRYENKLALKLSPRLEAIVVAFIIKEQPCTKMILKHSLPTVSGPTTKS